MPVRRYTSGINIYEEDCLPYLREAGELVSLVLAKLIARCTPGVCPIELDALAESIIRDNGATPLFKGFNKFPNSTCISSGEYLVHGIPDKKPLELGDVVSIDLGVRLKGFCGDSARTIIVGQGDKTHLPLLDITRDALKEGIKRATPLNTTGDIGRSIHQTILRDVGLTGKPKYSIFYRFSGHGIGLDLHEEPAIPNVGILGKGTQLEAGMCICIEPVVMYSTSQVVIDQDLDTGVAIFKTSDLRPSAHFEHQVYISKAGPIILTDKYI